MRETDVDVLAVGAHPDDVEIGIGGTILRLVDEGRRVAILDLTRGELGSRGTSEARRKEAREAAKALGVVARECAELPDGGLTDSVEQRQSVIGAIRAMRPKTILSHMKPDRHPDHEAASELVRHANFYSGVGSIQTGTEAYRAATFLQYRPYYEDATPPQFVVDVSSYFEKKLEVLKCFRSQFHNPNYEGPETMISSEKFWAGIRTRAAYWGYCIGVEYGEPLFSDMPAALESLPGLRETQ